MYGNTGLEPVKKIEHIIKLVKKIIKKIGVTFNKSFIVF
jgi:hypothetical protein